MGNSNASDVNTLTTVIGDGNYTSGDNGEMAEGLYSDSLIPKITDNESFTSAMPKLTRIVNNVRYLVHALGTSDITQIGAGTLTGAISTLNSNLDCGTNIVSFTITNQWFVIGHVDFNHAFTSTPTVIVNDTANGWMSDIQELRPSFITTTGFDIVVQTQTEFNRQIMWMAMLV